MFVDTHCHLFSRYYDDLDEVILRCIDNNVKVVIVNGYDMKSNKEVLELVEKYDIVYGALGIQPLELDDYENVYESLEFISNHINDHKIVAVGEIGLDFHYTDTNKDVQRELFLKQLEIARVNKKPVIVHSRDCIQETYDILKMSKIMGVLHCYSGSAHMALEFNNIVDVIKSVPIEYIILETDCPYLAPEPYRGKRNESSYIPVIASRIADLKCLDLEMVRDITTSNARRLFDI